MTVHHSFDVWPTITSLVAANKRGPVVAAVAYIGVNGHEHLPLREGDLLVCDASEPAARNGSTSPAGLREFIDRGVEVWSHQGLHAKVVVLNRRAFVGSQNASDNSASYLLEAAIETTDTDDVRELREFVRSLGEVPVDSKYLADLPSAYKQTRPGPRAHRTAELPDRLEKIHVVGIDYADRTRDEEAAVTKGVAIAGRGARRLGTGVRTDDVAATKWVYQRVSVGDWVIQQDEKSSFSPGVVVAKADIKNGHMLWIARPKCATSDVTTDDVDSIPGVGQLSTLEGQAATDAIDCFR